MIYLIYIYFYNTIFIIITTGIIGAILVKSQGITILNKALGEIKSNKIPIFSIFEGIANLKFFPEMMPIVNPYEMEGQYSYQQMSRFTSDMAKITGEILTFGNPGNKEFYQSPKIIDHIVRNTFGFPGRLISNSPNLATGRTAVKVTSLF